MIWVAIIIVFVYIALVAEFALGPTRVDDFYNGESQAVIAFTVIIPFRNEEINLPRLLKHIRKLDYPTVAYEIILVNDASNDASVDILRRFIQKNSDLPLLCINNKRATASPKKDAIVTAINQARYEWIVTTDADCTFDQKWLSILSDFITDKRPKMVVGPVRIENIDQPSFLNAFEQLDFLSLMGATLGGFGMRKPFLCNGAHLAYEKKAFLEVNGFSENDHIASGDDHFLLEKFNKRFPTLVMYLKSPLAVVTTQPQEYWQSFISQRLRWAAKATGYSQWFSKFVGLLVLLANFTVAILLLMLPLDFVLWKTEVLNTPIFEKAISSQLLIFAILSKYIADYFLIAQMATFLKRRSYLKWYPLVAMSYPFISSYIAMRALIGGFAWKGRQYKR